MRYKAKLNQKLTDEKILGEIWPSIKEARAWKKDTIDSKISKWLSIFNKDPYGNEVKGRSNTVDATVRNYCKSVETSLLEPIMTTSDIVRMKANLHNDVNDGQLDNLGKEEALLNYQFNRQMDKHDKMDEAVKLFVREAMVATKVYWEYKSKDIIVDSIFPSEDPQVPEKAIYKALTSEELEQVLIAHQAMDHQAMDIKASEDGDLTDITFIKTDIISENPTFDTIPICNIFWNKSASKISYVRHNMDFMGEVKVMSASDIRHKIKTDKSYRKFSKEELDDLFKAQNIEFLNDSVSEQVELAGKIRAISDEIRKEYKLTSHNKQVVVELHMWMDIDQDGEDELLHIEIMNDKIIKLQLNDQVNNMIPYNVAFFDKTPFDTGSDSIPGDLADTQRLKTGIVRNMQDTMAYGTLQNYALDKGALSKVEERRFKNRVPGDIIKFNPGKMGGSIRDRLHAIPAESIKKEYFDVYNILDKEAQENAGISAFTQSLDGSSLDATATGASIKNTMGMKRLLKYMRALIEGMLKPTLEAYRVMNARYLDGVQFSTDDNGIVNISKDDIDLDADIYMKVAIKGFDSEKINQILQALQLVQGMIQFNVATPADLTDLYKELMELWDFTKIANRIQHSSNQNPQEQAMGNQGPQFEQNGINNMQQSQSGYNNSYQQ